MTATAAASIDLLAALAAHQDATAWGLLVERHGAAMYRSALAVTSEAGCADDAVQEALLHLRQRAGRFRGAPPGVDPEDAVRRWLQRLAANAALHLLRAERRRRQRERQASLPAAMPEEPAMPSRCEPAQLSAALQHLSDGDRQAILLRHLEGLDGPALAAALGCAPGAARVRLHRALERMRGHLARAGVVLSLAMLSSRLDAVAAVWSQPPAGSAGWVALHASTRTPRLPFHLVNGTPSPMTIAALVATLPLLATALVLAQLGAAEPARPPAPAPASAAVAAAAQPPAAPSADELTTLAAGNNRWALDLYGKLQAREEGNLFVSPFSLRTALAMTYAGARGETATQMKKALHVTLDDARHHAASGEALRRLNASGQGRHALAVANSLWGEQTHAFLQPFLALNQTCYGGGLERVDFINAAEPARQTINRWVAEKTQQKIPDLIPPQGVTAATRLALVNAVYFKGAWALPFDQKLTREELFGHPAGERTLRAPLMRRTAEFRHAELQMVEHATGDTGPGNGLVQVLELPYAGDAVSMVVLLPHVNTNLGDLQAELTVEKLETALAALHQQKVEVYLPRFRMTWGTRELGPKGTKTLPDLGIRDAFVYPTADFSGMDGTRKLFIGAVFHKAFVDVNEEGTEAAAATAVVMVKGAPPRPQETPVFRADRPFLFLIRERASGSILFLGRVTDPTRA